MTKSPSPIYEHLIDIRTRLLRSLMAVLCAFLGLVYFAQELYVFIATPLIKELPEGAHMIATDITAPFFTPFKLTLFLALIITIPFILSQAWAFISPALFKEEKRLFVTMIFGSTLLFYAGMLFAFYVVFPLVFAFFTQVAPQGVMINTDISLYLSFVLKILLAFGLAFQIPIAVLLLCWSGSITTQTLKTKRPYIIVAVFIIGMLLTPPDIFSQSLLAIPMWLLFELGLFFADHFPFKKTNQSNIKPAFLQREE